MTINAVGYKSQINAPSFQGLPMKKWGVGLASFALPGAGQLINSQGRKAAGFFAGTTIPTIGSLLLSDGKNMATLGTALLLSLTSLGIAVWGIVDAVKNVKPDQA